MKTYTFVKINGKDFPIKFGFNSLRKYSDATNTSLSDLDKLGSQMTLNEALLLIYYGLEDGYRAAKQPCEITIDDLSDLIDEDFDALTKCMEILGEQMHNRNKRSKGKK